MTAIQTAKTALSSQSFALEIRRLCLTESKRANVGHIGSALSIAELVAVLYWQILNIPSTRDPERDRFILSKGHAVLALYAALHLKGFMSRETLATFCEDNSALGGHPEIGVDGIDFATGSLGMGLSFGTGAALAAKRAGANRRAFVLVSDAELNEGSLWESALFAGHHQLSNLVAIVDQNGQQALGYTKEILDTDSVEQKFKAFNWRTHVVDGHDCDQLEKILKELDYKSGQPHAIIAKTTFGKGVSFMENQIQWHYLPMNDAQFEQAMKEIEC
ncbi:MAG: transketolase [Leptolyngbya sp.]|nr:transketolase [Candidatus Melainabacteria bacterium]